ncbi:hypothetical protein TI03_04400 [Achromatium sp. WMS1]|nr:hypothetical protein TI03_04400 [Achromatium sp. WMS1]
MRYPLAPAFNALLDRIFATPGDYHFVIDLSNADNIDSTCIGILAKIANRSSNQNRPIIITGTKDIRELLLAVCFNQFFDLVETVDSNASPPKETKSVPDVNLPQKDMLTLLLESHKRLCGINAKNHAIFKDVVEALEHEVISDQDRRRLI